LSGSRWATVGAQYGRRGGYASREPDNDRRGREIAPRSRQYRVWIRAKTPDKGIEYNMAHAGLSYVSLIESGNLFVGLPDWLERYTELLNSSGELLTRRLRSINGVVAYFARSVAPASATARLLPTILRGIMVSASRISIDAIGGNMALQTTPCRGQGTAEEIEPTKCGNDVDCMACRRPQSAPCSKPNEASCYGSALSFQIKPKLQGHIGEGYVI